MSLACGDYKTVQSTNSLHLGSYITLSGVYTKVQITKPSIRGNPYISYGFVPELQKYKTHPI
mgnify:CR=1 FL=1